MGTASLCVATSLVEPHTVHVTRRILYVTRHAYLLYLPIWLVFIMLISIVFNPRQMYFTFRQILPDACFW